jgi:hypothetical protein
MPTPLQGFWRIHAQIQGLTLFCSGFVILLLFLALSTACGGGSNGGGNTGPTITSVSASCSPASIQTGHTSQCTATVTGTGP